jgi:hypothetical protein
MPASAASKTSPAMPLAAASLRSFARQALKSWASAGDGPAKAIDVRSTL